MAATIASAFKALIEQGGLGLAVYRDGAPVKSDTSHGPSWPHVVVQDGIAFGDLAHGDYGDPDADAAILEAVQVDLFQLARQIVSPTRTVVTENYRLPDRLARLLRGTAVQRYAPVRVHGSRIVTANRWPIADNILRHTWTVNVYRTDEEITP